MLYLVFSVILLLYFVVIIGAINGWNKKSVFAEKNNFSPTFSVIIAVRNEEKNCESLIKSLAKQDYPAQLFEVIIIDDHSTDNTFSILQELTKDLPNFIIKESLEDSVGKKAAISLARTFAKNDFYIFTDGDCSFGNKWISSYAKYITKEKDVFLFGAVNHVRENSFVQKLFTLDFLSMVGTQAGLAQNNHAFSCNAANMCISRNIANLSSNNKFASGDDVFLLHSAKKTKKIPIVFVKEKDAMVYTNPPKDINHFLQQRIRWSSKSSGYTDFDSIYISSIVYITSASIFTVGITSIFLFQFFWLFVFLLASKTIIDLVFFSYILRFFGKNHLTLLSIPFQLFYYIYITLIPIFALVSPLKWKGRKIS